MLWTWSRETSGCPQLIALPIPVDLGYSWRPDKAAFFPRGPKTACYPSWFSVAKAIPVYYDGYAEELLRIRDAVAHPEHLSAEERAALHHSIEAIAVPYQQYFEAWFEAEDVDWVCAINMTLSDSVSVTLALHRAAEKRWGKGRDGGVLFWDHDLLKSYAVHEDNKRVYPSSPNEFTPVPQDVPWHTWAVVSDPLARETKFYPTSAEPMVVPNILPIIPNQRLDLDNQSIIPNCLHRLGILEGVRNGRPVLLCPVRIFPVKGIEISIRLFAAIQSACHKRDLPVPYLLIFGDPEEDPKYATALKALADDLNVSQDIRFMGGVPICSGVYREVPRLDEKDLLCVAAATHGGVLFSPCTRDVESVGLGPALASIAGIPCAVTNFNALRQVYSNELHCVLVDVQSQQSWDVAAEELVDILFAPATGLGAHQGEGKDWSEKTRDNKALMMKMFPTRPWKELLLDLACKAGIDDDAISETRSALGMLNGA
ncbi:Glycosyltransferase family 4 protein [Mycena sanguinolenta]|uniref:Glycosyltransferase family 4 protein n=1 Tax=Mycena sanguinolenta TaxID=230812 RepID=A0A8H6XFW6_9AGAR|nr:Glycosyltransferase family 4 protein [Mycena sanguinolenta]